MTDKNILIVFTLAFIALAAVHCIFGICSDSVLLAVLTKILPLLLLTAVVCIYGFRPFVVAALITSMLGDTASEIQTLGEYRMPLQITFFAIAQICYARDFLRFRQSNSNGRIMTVLPFMMGIYGLLEILTLICACLQERRRKWSFILGASLFLVSDAIILARFLTGGFPFASLLVMITYYLAQYFLNVQLICTGDHTSVHRKRVGLKRTR